MQALINRSLGEMRREECRYQAVRISREAWHYPRRHPRRNAIAKACIALVKATAPTPREARAA